MHTVLQSAPPQQLHLETHYTELLKLVGEIGRDVKPAYTNNKVSTDRLRKSKSNIFCSDKYCDFVLSWSDIMIARGVVRECLSDLDRLYGNLNGHSYR